ncbi:hypothetical protein KBC04_00725 [Candidatus Babeliales bacterium]|nr:hypothetical protein [Candidatus Babeliales bacterium]MBP9843385.1 hypothetical protein [Candidatus Babeliales bacterium]
MTLQQSIFLKKIFNIALRFLFLIIFWNINLYARRADAIEFTDIKKVFITAVDEVNPNTYDGLAFPATAQDGSVNHIPIFYDGNGGYYSNNIRWHDEVNEGEGYLYFDTENGVSIIKTLPQSTHSMTGYQGITVNHSTNSSSQQNLSNGSTQNSSIALYQKKSAQQPIQSTSGKSRGEIAFATRNLEKMAQDGERERQQDIYHRHQQIRLYHERVFQSGLNKLFDGVCYLSCQGGNVPVRQEDLSLIEGICQDNGHFDQDILLEILAHDPRFNSIQDFLASSLSINVPSYLIPGLKINFNRFNHLEDRSYRIEAYHFYTQKWEQQKREQEIANKIAFEKKEKARQIALEKIAYNELKSQQKIDSGNLRKQHTQEKLELDRKYNKEKNQTKNKSKLVTINNEYKKEKNELAIKQAHEQTLLDAQHHKERPTLFSSAAKRVAEIQYQIFPTDKNKTAEVLRAEAQQAAAIQDKIQEKNSEQKAAPTKEPATHKISVQELEQSLHDFVTQNSNLEQNTAFDNRISLEIPVKESQQLDQKVLEQKISSITAQDLQELQQHNNDIILHSQKDIQQNSPFQKVMEHRSNAFEESLKKQTPTVKKYSLNPQTAGFLQAQGIDTSQFQRVDGLDIQHLLTEELLDVLDSVANMNLYKNLEIYQQNLAQYCATLASLSQQCNQAGLLPETMQGTNCCHGITHYLDGSLTGAPEQFQTGMQYFNTVLDYGQAIAYGLATGAIDAMPVALAMTAAAAVLSPVVVGLATQAAFVTTAVYVGYLCQQAWVESEQLQTYFLKENWDKVHEYLDQTYEYVTKLETVENGAHFVGRFAGSYSVSAALQQLRSLQPVIGIVKSATGQISVSTKLVNKQEYINNLIQARELLEHPDFQNFKMHFKRILGIDIFTIAPNTNSISNRFNSELVPAIAGIPQDFMNSTEQSLLAKIFLQSESVLVKNGANTLGDQVASKALQAVDLVEKSAQEIMHDVIQQEIMRDIIQKEITLAMQQKPVITDLTTPITGVQIDYFQEKASLIYQLQDLAKYTDNFKNLENLILEDVCYLNRIYELQPYRAQIKNFLDLHKLYFMYNNEKYFIEDIASYHIHAGDYYRKQAPKGGHSNFGGNKLDYFNPTITKDGPLGAKDVIFYNSRKPNIYKDSTIYPEDLSEFTCDLKAIEMMLSKSVEISERTAGTLIISGKTPEGLDIIVHYDIANKRIKTHYPDVEKF